MSLPQVFPTHRAKLNVKNLVIATVKIDVHKPTINENLHPIFFVYWITFFIVKPSAVWAFLFGLAAV